MKKIIFLLLFGFSLSADSQWTINAYINEGPTSRLEVLSEDVFLRYGGFYEIYRSNNGGIWWDPIAIDYEYSFWSDVSFIDEEIGFAGGGTWFGNYRACIAKTIDGGQTWDTISANNFDEVGGYMFEQIDFVDENLGFGIVDGYMLVRTSDGGQNFDILDLPTSSSTASIHSVDFLNDELGFVTVTENNFVDQTYRIFKSTDQGDNWTEVHNHVEIEPGAYDVKSISKIQAYDENNIFGVGANSGFIKSNDGGDTWEYSTITPGTTALTVLQFVSPTSGFTNNAGIIHKTNDGGQNWTIQTVNPISVAYDLQMMNENLGYFLGSNAIYKTTTGGEIVGIEEFEENEISIYPNPVKDSFSINMMNPENVESVVVYDFSGRQVKHFNKNLNDLDVSDLSSGIYVVQVLKCYELFETILIVE